MVRIDRGRREASRAPPRTINCLHSATFSRVQKGNRIPAKGRDCGIEPLAQGIGCYAVRTFFERDRRNNIRNRARSRAPPEYPGTARRGHTVGGFQTALNSRVPPSDFTYRISIEWSPQTTSLESPSLGKSTDLMAIETCKACRQRIRPGDHHDCLGFRSPRLETILRKIGRRFPGEFSLDSGPSCYESCR